MHNSWAEINLNVIAYNLSQIRKKIGPKIKILLPVKANAYGHGIIEVSNIAEGGFDLIGTEDNNFLATIVDNPVIPLRFNSCPTFFRY